MISVERNTLPTNTQDHGCSSFSRECSLKLGVIVDLIGEAERQQPSVLDLIGEAERQQPSILRLTKEAK